MADTRPIPGDVGRFDPVASFPRIVEYAGVGVNLIAIRAQFVKSDGTMELNASYSPAPQVTYEFVRKLDRAPNNVPPIGAGGANTEDWYEPIHIYLYQPGQWRKVTSSSVSYTYMNQGMQRDVELAVNGLSRPIVERPICSFADLWAEALKHDAPVEAVAIIDYDANGYVFMISGLGVRLEFGLDCKVKTT